MRRSAKMLLFKKNTQKTDASKITQHAEWPYADPEGAETGCLDRPNLKYRKNIGFLSNTSFDPLNNRKATKPANVWPSLACQRKWRFAGGPIITRLLCYFDPFSLSLPSSKKKKKKALSELDPLWQNYLDP